jgi:K+-sensing histidine kinase KdpD
LTTRLRDNGRGLEGRDPVQIFQPYMHGEEEGGGGYSLGLALVSKVMARMGGRVWAEVPDSGHGAIMCLDLPAG